MSSHPPEEPQSFEETLARLEEVTAALEDPETGLQEAIVLFEEGTRLALACKKKLEAAEQRVEKLKVSLAEGSEPEAEAEPSGDDDSEPQTLFS